MSNLLKHTNYCCRVWLVESKKLKYADARALRENVYIIESPFNIFRVQYLQCQRYSAFDCCKMTATNRQSVYGSEFD